VQFDSILSTPGDSSTPRVATPSADGDSISEQLRWREAVFLFAVAEAALRLDYPSKLYSDVEPLAADLSTLARHHNVDEVRHLAELAIWADSDAHERFDYAFTLAFARGELMQLAHDNAETLRGSGQEVTRTNLLAAFDAALANPYHRSKLIPWSLSTL
jgi:hypothetical protein